MTMKFEDPNFSISKKGPEYNTESEIDPATMADAVLAYRGDFAIDATGRDVDEATWTDAKEGKDFTLFRISEDAENKRASYRLEFSPSDTSEQEVAQAIGTYLFGRGEGATSGRKGGALLDDEGKPNDDPSYHARRLGRFLNTGLPPEEPPEDVGPENPMKSGWENGSET